MSLAVQSFLLLSSGIHQSTVMFLLPASSASIHYLRHASAVSSAIANNASMRLIQSSEHAHSGFEVPDSSKFMDIHNHYSLIAVVALMSLFLVITIATTGFIIAFCSKKNSVFTAVVKEDGSVTVGADGVSGTDSTYELDDLENSDVETKRDKNGAYYYHLSDDDDSDDNNVKAARSSTYDSDWNVCADSDKGYDYCEITHHEKKSKRDKKRVVYKKSVTFPQIFEGVLGGSVEKQSKPLTVASVHSAHALTHPISKETININDVTCVLEPNPSVTSILKTIPSKQRMQNSYSSTTGHITHQKICQSDHNQQSLWCAQFTQRNNKKLVRKRYHSTLTATHLFDTATRPRVWKGTKLQRSYSEHDLRHTETYHIGDNYVSPHNRLPGLGVSKEDTKVYIAPNLEIPSNCVSDSFGGTAVEFTDLDATSVNMEDMTDNFDTTSAFNRLKLQLSYDQDNYTSSSEGQQGLITTEKVSQNLQRNAPDPWNLNVASHKLSQTKSSELCRPVQGKFQQGLITKPISGSSSRPIVKQSGKSHSTQNKTESLKSADSTKLPSQTTLHRVPVISVSSTSISKAQSPTKLDIKSPAACRPKTIYNQSRYHKPSNTPLTSTHPVSVRPHFSFDITKPFSTFNEFSHEDTLIKASVKSNSTTKNIDCDSNKPRNPGHTNKNASVLQRNVTHSVLPKGNFAPNFTVILGPNSDVATHLPIKLHPPPRTQPRRDRHGQRNTHLPSESNTRSSETNVELSTFQTKVSSDVNCETRQIPKSEFTYVVCSESH